MSEMPQKIEASHMFGYVTNKTEIKFKDFDVYRSFTAVFAENCGRDTGYRDNISLTYDMTFVVLQAAFMKPPTKKGTSRCVVHPLKPSGTYSNSARWQMNALRTDYKCTGLAG